MATTGLTILLSVVTFNFWGLPDVGFQVLSPLRAERRIAVCEELKKSKWDLVFLQEVWVKEDRDALKKCGYDHSLDLENTKLAIDSGLLTLSRYPLGRPDRLTYAQPTQPNISSDGESLVRKSAILARLEHPNGAVWVAQTHLVSVYDEKNDAYEARRLQQLKAFVKWATGRAGSEPLIVGGDLNITPHQPLWKEVRAQLKDFTEAPQALDACTICPPNPLHEVNEGKPDHLFISPGAFADSGDTVLKDTFTHEKDAIPLSDHYGWQTSFRIER